MYQTVVFSSTVTAKNHNHGKRPFLISGQIEDTADIAVARLFRGRPIEPCPHVDLHPHAVVGVIQDFQPVIAVWVFIMVW